MKKSLFLLPLLALGLVACGGNSSGTGSHTNSAGGGTSEVEPGPVSTQAPTGDLIATYDFTGLTGVGTEITDPQATLGSLGSAITWTSATKVYDGNGTGGGKPNTAGMLKFGTSGAQGVLTFTVNEAVSSIVLNCHSFYALSGDYPTNTTNYVSVNDMTPVVAPYNATADGEDVRFDLAASGTTITIKSCNPDGTGVGRILLYSISLYR